MKRKFREKMFCRFVDSGFVKKHVMNSLLDLNHGRIGKIENLEPLTQLESLYLRWNMIKTIENLSNLGATLRELELYDNQISKLENLDSLVNLEILDVSHNRLRKIEGLENLTKLKKLYLVSNKITKIENLSHLKVSMIETIS